MLGVTSREVTNEVLISSTFAQPFDFHVPHQLCRASENLNTSRLHLLNNIIHQNRGSRQQSEMFDYLHFRTLTAADVTSFYATMVVPTGNNVNFMIFSELATPCVTKFSCTQCISKNNYSHHNLQSHFKDFSTQTLEASIML